MAVTTRVTLVADTYTNITTQFEALGNNIKVLTQLTDVSVGFVRDGITPTALRSITGGVAGPAALMSKPEGSTDDVYAYSTAGGNIYLHGNTDHVEVVDKDYGVVADLVTPGTGISVAGTASVKSYIAREGNLIKTTLVIDIQGLSSSAGTTDIIGEAATANCWFYQVTAAKNGTIFEGTIKALETPATGDVDIDLYSADEATGTEDAAVTALTDDRLLVNGASLALGGLGLGMVLFPGPDQYLYLTGAGSTDGEYSAGKFMITMTGVAA